MSVITIKIDSKNDVKVHYFLLDILKKINYLKTEEELEIFLTKVKEIV